jgi:hypothetical protein
LPGVSGIALPDVTSFAMFSLVHAIFAAEAGLKARAVVSATTVTRSFIFLLPGRTMRPELKIGKVEKVPAIPIDLR